MSGDLSPQHARLLKSKLLNSPVAPGGMAHVINVGTDAMLDVLETQYFERELAEGISCFKYLEGDYGTGKTQFINCLAKRAHARNIVTSIVSIGQECPFSSPLAIYRNVVSSLMPPPTDEDPLSQQRGIEILFQTWIRSQLRKMGVTPGNAVPESVRQQIERPFVTPWLGSPDAQTANALLAVGRRLTAFECGATLSPSDQELICWVRGDAIRSNNLKQAFALHEPATDATAFQRLKTVVGFLRERLNFKGFFVAFDEGTRTMSFRRGTVKQRQAIENMLTMINQNAEGEFGGVMFLYAATPDFRIDVIQNTYIALRDRIGSVAFAPGRPMTPLIKLDDVNTDDTLTELGTRLLDVFAKADGVNWDRDLQTGNMYTFIEAQKRSLGFPTTVPPRFFVFYWCRFLAEQAHKQYSIELEDAIRFVETNRLPETESA